MKNILKTEYNCMNEIYLNNLNKLYRDLYKLFNKMIKLLINLVNENNKLINNLFVSNNAGSL